MVVSDPKSISALRDLIHYFHLNGDRWQSDGYFHFKVITYDRLARELGVEPGQKYFTTYGAKVMPVEAR